MQQYCEHVKNPVCFKYAFFCFTRACIQTYFNILFCLAIRNKKLTIISLFIAGARVQRTRKTTIILQTDDKQGKGTCLHVILTWLLFLGHLCHNIFRQHRLCYRFYMHMKIFWRDITLTRMSSQTSPGFMSNLILKLKAKQRCQCVFVIHYKFVMSKI